MWVRIPPSAPTILGVCIVPTEIEPGGEVEYKVVIMTDWKAIALKLYQYLDDIDTCMDVYKPKQTEYTRAVDYISHKRHELLHTDGYKVFSPNDYND